MAALLAVTQTEGDQAAITEIANLNQSQYIYYVTSTFNLCIN